MQAPPKTKAYEPIRRPPSEQETVSLELVSALFMILGLGIWGVFIFSVLRDQPLKDATSGRSDQSAILAFLDSFGLVVPFLAIVLGYILFRLGQRLRSGHITPARWATVALTWLIIGCIVVGIAEFVTAEIQKTVNNVPTQVWDFQEAVTSALPFLIAAVIFFIALRWINSVIELIFTGEESLSSANARVAWNLLIPTVAVLILVAARPLEETFITSLTDKRFGSAQTAQWVGLDNYQKLLSFRLDTVDCSKNESGNCEKQPNGSTKWELINIELLREGYRTATVIGFGDTGLAISGKDANFLNALGNTLRFTILSVLLELVLGLFVAMVVNSQFVGRGLLRTAMLVPWAIPTVVSARLWETMLRDNNSGILNKIATDIGLISAPKAWLADPALQLNALIAIDVWKTIPFMALLLLAGLQTIPADIYEAAAVDGASKVRQFFNITLPLLRPTIAVALVFRTLDALRAFDVFQVLLGRAKLSLATYNYETLIQNQQGGYASAIGVLIFVLIFTFTVIYVRSLGVEAD